MKKKAVLLLCTLMTVSMLCSCGNSADSTSSASAESTSSTSAESTSTESVSADSTSAESTSSDSDELPTVSEDTPLSDCLTLGNYEGLELTRTITKVSDDDVMENIQSELMETIEDPDEPVKEGDTVDIDFVGKLDGEAFDGGSATDYSLEIGSDTFIDGFEDGIIGMKTGETKDLNLTFPEDYGSTDLAGKDVVFTVTVNVISRPCEYSEEWVKENYPDYASGDDFLAARKEELQASNEESAQSDLENNVFQTVYEDTTFKALREDYVTLGENAYDSMLEQYSTYYGVDVDTLISEYLGGEEQYEASKKSYGEDYAKQLMLIYAIAEDQGWTTESQEYQDLLTDYADQNNVTTDELIEDNGEDRVNTAIFYELALNKILDSATITDEYVESTSSSSEE